MIRRFWLGDPFDDLGFSVTTDPSWHRWEWYDKDKYELKPREDYKKELIEEKKAEIARLDEQKKKLESEIRDLKGG
jgi:hypothetical protein